MELTMVNGFETVTFANLDEQEMMLISGGEFLEGLAHVISGGAMVYGSAQTFTALSAMTTTKVVPALLMVGGAAGASLALACGVVAVCYGVYEMCN